MRQFDGMSVQSSVHEWRPVLIDMDSLRMVADAHDWSDKFRIKCCHIFFKNISESLLVKADFDELSKELT